MKTFEQGYAVGWADAIHKYESGQKKSMGISLRDYFAAQAMTIIMGWQGIGLHHRLRAAWLVFTGKADAVRWFE